MEVFCGIDVGGTSVKVGIVDAAGNLLTTGALPTPTLDAAGCAQVLACAKGLLREMPRATVAGVGAGVPGAIDGQGRVTLMPNAVVDTGALRRAAQDAFGSVPFAAGNDANMAALGEAWRGAAAGCANMALVTLGTGVGAGMVMGGRPVAGAHGGTGEIGHLLVVPHGRPCNCGNAGCLEQYASASALVRLANEAAGDALAHASAAPRVRPADADASKMSAEKPATAAVQGAHATGTVFFRNVGDVFAALAQGNPCAARAVSALCDALGLALAQTACVVDPEVFLMGGGLSHFFPHYADELRCAFARHAPATCRETRIERAALGNAAGTIGAARAAMLASR